MKSNMSQDGLHGLQNTSFPVEYEQETYLVWQFITNWSTKAPETFSSAAVLE